MPTDDLCYTLADGRSHKFQGQNAWNSARRKLWKHHSLHVPVALSLSGEKWNCVNSSVSWEKTGGKNTILSNPPSVPRRHTTPRNIKRLHFISHRPPQTPRKVPLASRASDPWPPQRCNATLNICQVPATFGIGWFGGRFAWKLFDEFRELVVERATNKTSWKIIWEKGYRVRCRIREFEDVSGVRLV